MPVTVRVRQACEQCLHGTPDADLGLLYEALRAILHDKPEPRVFVTLCDSHAVLFEMWATLWLENERETS